MMPHNFRSKVVVLLISLGIYLPISLFGNRHVVLMQSNWRYARISKQAIAYYLINVFQEVPKSLKDLPESPNFPGQSKMIQKYIDYYDPNAWQNPQRIFFMHKHGHLYYVTFGDGSQAVLKLWRCPYPRENVRQGQIQWLQVHTGWFEHWIRLIAFGIVAMLIYAVAAASFLKTKGVKANKAHSDRNKSMTDTCSGDG